MAHLIVGLGNLGEEYQNTRHNTGHLAVEYLQNQPELKGAKLVALESLMNNSGKALLELLKAKSYKLKADSLIVVHDDLDLPLGHFKLSFNRGAGGYRG